MREAHNAFGEARQRVYIGRQDYFKNITEARDKGITKPFIILGESGRTIVSSLNINKFFMFLVLFYFFLYFTFMYRI